MTKTIFVNGKTRVPVLTRSGLLDMRAAVAYGIRPSNTFILSTYVSCRSQFAGSRGGQPVLVDALLDRVTVPNDTPEDVQRHMLEASLLVWATRLGNDFELRLPIETRKQPKYMKEK